MGLFDLIQQPPRALLEAFTDYLGSAPAAGSGGLIPTCSFGQTDLLLLAPKDGVRLRELLDTLPELDVEGLSSPEAYEVLIGLIGPLGRDLSRNVVSRGVAAVPLHAAIAQVLGLPAGFRPSQEALLTRPLEPLRISGDLRIADMHLVIEAAHSAARSWLAAHLTSWEASPTNVVYLEAEAGKGKSTLLAEAVLRQVQANTGPLPIYVPLRSLQRGTGVSWPDIAACVGVVGPAVESVMRGLRSGLLALVLDGLDEIAGRYDPAIVKSVLDIVLRDLRRTRSRLILSGRRTEASLLDTDSCLLASLDLPSTSEQAFTDYAGLVIRTIAPVWPSLYLRVPEPPLDVPTLPAESPAPQQEAAILDWIKLVFDDLGKERSLFFVQSLACIARTYQLAGNRPLVIRNPAGNKLARASLYDVCILAATLACIREQDKVEPLAHDMFTPVGQLDLLTWLAVRAAAPDSIRAQLPNPNELAKDLFHIDPVNQNEEFTAVVRQIQKHALLFASVDPSIRIGDWRPSFLSEWIKDALLCRAWRLREAMAGHSDLGVIVEAIVRSQRTSLAFQYVFPELAADEHLSDLPELAAALRLGGGEDGSPEACAHYWELRAGLGEDSLAALGDPPTGLAPLADLSELDFEGVEFDDRFSGTLVVLVETSLSTSSLRSCRLEQCDLTNATFTGCSFDGVEFSFCDGPVLFDGCVFVRTTIKALQSRSLPVAVFVDCVFGEGCILEQDQPASAAAGYGAAFRFDSCETTEPATALLRGSWLGLDPSRIDGLFGSGTDRRAHPAEACLRALLKLFFPVRAGAGTQRQARGYIRSSAIGRGSLPQGSPSATALEDVLRSVGFTSGGRRAHLYAPWASIVGSGAEAVSLRNEMIAFLATGRRSPRIEELIDRVRRLGSWS